VAGLNIDFNTIIGLWMAGAVLMVPLVALSVRFAVVPLLDSVARLRAARVARDWEDHANVRFARLERRVADLNEMMAGRGY
jgi:hypothetical protein